MNRCRPHKLLIAAVAMVMPLASASAANPPDKNLEAVLRVYLQEPTKELTDDHYVRVSVLHASDKGIRDLTGLEKCKNLAELRLSKKHNAHRKGPAGSP